jgi:hypothetical protein
MNWTEQWIGAKTGVISRTSLGEKSFYEVRKFEHATLPYLELWFGAYRFQCGFISAGRFQVQFRTYP